MRLLILLALAGSAVAHADDEHPPPAPAQLAKKLQLIEVARARQPVALTAAGKRLLLAEKGGRLRVIDNGILQPGAILDLSDRVSHDSEQGLLGVAVKGTNVYVNYTDKKGDTRVREYPLSDHIDPDGGRELLHVRQPWANHNGGHLLFGPDGKLYVGLGDGGSGYDPQRNGQNPDVHLAKMLRISDQGQLEVLHIGLRNPWRYDFDKKTGDLYIADVGQDRWEEIDVAPAGSGRLNFGWSVMEGRHCLRGKSCDATGMTPPIVEYSHKTGCSITGGIVYRGKALPELDGAYFYSDYCTAIVRSLRYNGGAVVDHWDWKAALDPDNQLTQVSSFGADADGELYLLSLDGPIYKLVRK